MGSAIELGLCWLILSQVYPQSDFSGRQLNSPSLDAWIFQNWSISCMLMSEFSKSLDFRIIKNNNKTAATSEVSAGVRGAVLCLLHPQTPHPSLKDGTGARDGTGLSGMEACQPWLCSLTKSPKDTEMVR